MIARLRVWRIALGLLLIGREAREALKVAADMVGRPTARKEQAELNDLFRQATDRFLALRYAPRGRWDA